MIGGYYRKENGAMIPANEQVEMILDSITDRFFALDKDWRYTYFNKHAEDQLWRLGKDPANLIGKVLWEVYPTFPADEEFRRAMAERVVITHEHYFPPLGEWVENRIYPSPEGGLAIYQRYVTGRKRAEEAVIAAKEDAERRAREAQEAQSILQTLLENAPAGITLTGGPPDFRIIANSKHGETLLGREPGTMVGIASGSYAGAFGMWMADGVTRPRPEQLPLYRATRTGEVIENEGWIIERPDGSRIHELSNVAPIRNPAGEIVGAIDCWRDITALKLAEAELKRLKDELAADLDSMNRLHELSTRLLATDGLQPLLEDVLDSVIELQHADFGVVQLYNSVARTLEIVAQRGFTHDFLNHFGAVDDDTAWGHALHRRKRVIIEDVQVDPDFEPLRETAARAGFRAVQSTPLFDRKGHPLGMLSTHFPLPHRPSERELRLTDLYAGLAQQMIERKRVEAALRRSEAYLVEGQKLSHMGSWAWNLFTGELFWSQEHFRICGVDPENFTLTMETARQFIHPDDREPASQSLERAVIERREFERDLRIICPDGTTRYVRSLGHPVFNDSGELTEYVGTIVDNTDQRNAEEALQNAQAELAHMARVTMMGELAVSIAHEVNQPLGALVTDAGACLRWLNGAEPNVGEAKVAAARIVEEGIRASEIIARIRSLLKKIPPHKAILEMNGVIDEVLILTRHEIGRHNIILRTEQHADLVAVQGDVVQLKQVLANLIINAIEAMADKRRGPRELLVTSRNQGPDRVLVAVHDSGPGIDRGRIEDIFKPFVTTKPEGMGMGLAISRSIVEAHGGRLWASAREGMGATFQFSLPAARHA
jgi:PAS domain S-box-containing protein